MKKRVVAGRRECRKSRNVVSREWSKKKMKEESKFMLKKEKERIKKNKFEWRKRSQSIEKNVEKDKEGNK